MTLRIEIKSPLVQEISGTTKAGKPYLIRKQSAYAYLYDNSGQPLPYPDRIELSLADGQQPYAPGNYALSDKCFYVGDFNSLAIGRLILDPIPPAARA